MRRENGVTIILLCFILGLITLPMLGLFSFECIRAISAREQLRSASESASLAGAAKLASSDVTNPTQAHNDAIDAAREAFRANSINGYPLTAAQAAGNEFYNPPANKSGVYVEFLNPNSNPPNQPVPIGNVNGRIVRVVGSWGHTPVFGAFLGLGGPYVMRAEGHGRVPQLDIVLAFDVSGSIDDQTPVTLIKRWRNTSNPLTHKISYKIARSFSSATTTGDWASGRIYDIVQPPPTGSGANAHNPQHMSTYNDSRFGLNTTGLRFSDGSSPQGWQIRGTPNTGGPSTGYSSEPQSGAANQGVFTHCVVNLKEDGNDHSWPPAGQGTDSWTSPAGFYYKNVFTALEAHLGNLDSVANFNAARLNNTPELNGVTPQAGYQADYIANAKKKVMPLFAAQDAAVTFFNIMNTNTEAHFGLTCFNTNAGQNSGETFTGTTWGDNYGGTAQYPRPGVALNLTQTQYNNCINAINSTVANGSTNIGEAIQRSRIWLNDPARFRPGARRCIVLFTDGQPTAPNGNSSDITYAQNQADLCNTNSVKIPIYTIGLAQNDAIVPGECDILNDGGVGQVVTYTNQSGNPASYTCTADGVAKRAGNGGKFFLVTNTAHLRLTFENIARQLVQLVKVD